MKKNVVATLLTLSVAITTLAGCGGSQAAASSKDIYYDAAATNGYDSYAPAAEASTFYEEDLSLEEPNTAEYKEVKEQGFVSVETQPFSTFGADVDTASYTNFRDSVLDGYQYPESAIRTEEFINYFDYGYKNPTGKDKFNLDVVLTDCPWNEDTKLLRVGAKAEEIDFEKEGVSSNLVLLIDTSGSMGDCIDLVKQSVGILAEQLDEDDTISVVTYAGSEGVLFDGITGDKKNKLIKEINKLETYGSTNGEGGINKAYELAEKHYIDGGNNRVILITDGDFNVGVSSEAALTDLIKEKKKSGVFLSCIGTGYANYSDTTMEALADNGDGNYNYIDSILEAKKVFGKELWGNLYTVAKDTKFQVEFNPDVVKGYRQIGYENRKMAAEDFEDDKKDGGEVGSGQTVTVLYEVVLTDSDYEMTHVTSRYQKDKKDDTEKDDTEKDDTEKEDEKATVKEEKVSKEQQELIDKYGEAPDGFEWDKEGNLMRLSEDKANTEDSTVKGDDEVCIVNVRYKEPDENESKLESKVVTLDDYTSKLDDDTSWAAGVAQFTSILRNSDYKGTSTLSEVKERLDTIADDDYKEEFVYIVNQVDRSGKISDFIYEE